jgi:hypothetical protein
MTRYIRGFSYFVTSITAPIASGWSEFAGWVSHPLENAAFARRTPKPEVRHIVINIVCSRCVRERLSFSSFR